MVESLNGSTAKRVELEVVVPKGELLRAGVLCRQNYLPPYIRGALLLGASGHC